MIIYLGACWCCRFYFALSVLVDSNNWCTEWKNSTMNLEYGCFVTYNRNWTSLVIRVYGISNIMRSAMFSLKRISLRHTDRERGSAEEQKKVAPLKQMIEPSPRIFEMIHARFFAMHRTINNAANEFFCSPNVSVFGLVCLCCFCFSLWLWYTKIAINKIFLDENEAFQLPRTNLLKRDVCLSKTASRRTLFFFQLHSTAIHWLSNCNRTSTDSKRI